MDSTQSAPGESRSLPIASFRRLLPLLFLHSIINIYSIHPYSHLFFIGGHGQLAALVSLFTTPFWCYIGDIKGRRFPLIISLLGTSLGLGLTLLPLPGSFFFFVVIGGLTGGYATFQGAIFSYITDVSSSKTLLPNLCISLAVELLGSFLAAFFIPWRSAPGKGVVGSILLCLYTYFLLAESRPQRIALPFNAEDQQPVQQGGYKTWVRSTSEVLKKKTRSFYLVFFAACVMFTVEAFTSDVMLQRMTGPKDWLVVPISFGIRVVMLITFGLALRFLPNTTNPAGLAKSIALGTTANTATSQIFATVGVVVLVPAVSIVFILFHTLSSPLIPAFTILLYFLWNGDIEHRGSFWGVLVVLEIVFETVGAILAFTLNRFSLVAQISVASVLALLAFTALVFAQVPPHEELEEHVSTISPDSHST